MMKGERIALIARELAQRAAGDASSEELDSVIAGITNPEVLWAVAEEIPPEIPAMGAIYRRAQAIGASTETAIGYLALAHIFNGNDQAASALVGDDFPESGDPVLLDAWTALAEQPTERVRRLRKALEAAPHSLRLWRSLASQALQVNAPDLAREAHLWLARHETNPVQLERIQTVLRKHGWLPPDLDVGA
jgi:hypothetical protein